MEGRINEVLAIKGLQGCYDFLHSFVLTHKLNVLRCQAAEMARHIWNGCIDVQAVHRSVVIQYWSTLGSSKNWIELGIASGRNNKYSSDTALQTSRISCRWFRRGHEVLDNGLEFDYVQLSTEAILDGVVARHASGRLTEMHHQLQSMAVGSTALSQQLNTSTDKPRDCWLRFHLKPAARPLTVAIEPVSGHLSISPRTAMTAEHEARVNKDQTLDPAQILRYVLGRALYDELLSRVDALGWTTVRLARQNDIPTLFAETPVRYGAFKREKWGTHYALGCTITFHGLKWWIVRLEGQEAQTIRSAKPLFSDADVEVPSALDRQSLLLLEARATHRIESISFTAECENASVRIKKVAEAGTDLLSSSLSPSTDWPKYIDAFDLLRSKSTTTSASSSRSSWSSGLLKLTYQDYRRDTVSTDKITILTRAAMLNNKVPDLIEQVTHGLLSEDEIKARAEFVFETRGEFPLGEPVLPALQRRLRSAERMYEFVRIAKRHHFVIHVVRSNWLNIRYASNPALFAAIKIADDGQNGVPVVLRLISEKKAGSNPHVRIQTYLQRLLRRTGVVSDHVDQKEITVAFDNFCRLLSFTLVALTTLQSICRAESVSTPTFETHSATAYKLTYPNSKQTSGRTFLIEAKRHNNKYWWLVRPVEKVASEQDICRKKIQEQIWNSRGREWGGLGRCASASAKGIEDLLRKLNDIVLANRTIVPDQPQQEHTNGASHAHDVVVLD